MSTVANANESSSVIGWNPELIKAEMKTSAHGFIDNGQPRVATAIKVGGSTLAAVSVERGGESIKQVATTKFPSVAPMAGLAIDSTKHEVIRVIDEKLPQCVDSSMEATVPFVKDVVDRSIDEGVDLASRSISILN